MTVHVDGLLHAFSVCKLGLALCKQPTLHRSHIFTSLTHSQCTTGRGIYIHTQANAVESATKVCFSLFDGSALLA